MRGNRVGTIPRMELTAHELRIVEFRERWRGYDPDEVDDFLERVAAALDHLNGRGALDADAGVQRTLVLAQRTADAAIAEAEERSKAIVEAALAERARLADEQHQPVRDDIATLEAVRDELQAEIAGLERRLDDERARVRALAAAIAATVEDGPAGHHDDVAGDRGGDGDDRVVDLVAVERAAAPDDAPADRRTPRANGASAYTHEPVDWRALATRLRKRLLTG